MKSDGLWNGWRGGGREEKTRLKGRREAPTLETPQQFPAAWLYSVQCSVNNKHDELALRAEHDCELRQSNLVCLTETWLKDHHESSSLQGYTTIRADRSEHSSRKSIGGGVCVSLWTTAGLHNTIYGSKCVRRTMRY